MNDNETILNNFGKDIKAGANKLVGEIKEISVEVAKIRHSEQVKDAGRFLFNGFVLFFVAIAVSGFISTFIHYLTWK